jgi:hypothetical protein
MEWFGELPALIKVCVVVLSGFWVFIIFPAWFRDIYEKRR